MSSDGPRDLETDGRLTRTELVEAVRALGFTKDEATLHVERVLELWSEALVTDGTIKLTGIGKLEVVRRSPREGRDLRTGDSIAVAARNTVAFRPAMSLRNAMTAKLGEDVNR